jgi:hypothetical protein
MHEFTALISLHCSSQNELLSRPDVPPHHLDRCPVLAHEGPLRSRSLGVITKIRGSTGATGYPES